MVASQLEDLTRKLNRQDEELRRREARINEFKDREQLLQQTLTTTQKLAEEMKVNARKEADIILSSAELQGRRSSPMPRRGGWRWWGRSRSSSGRGGAFLQQLQSLLDTHKSILDQMRRRTAGH